MLNLNDQYIIRFLCLVSYIKPLRRAVKKKFIKIVSIIRILLIIHLQIISEIKDLI